MSIENAILKLGDIISTGGNQTTVTINAEDLLTLIKTVDGQGSGLNADLLRGLDPQEVAVSTDVMTYELQGNNEQYLNRYANHANGDLPANTSEYYATFFRHIDTNSVDQQGLFVYSTASGSIQRVLDVDCKSQTVKVLGSSVLTDDTYIPHAVALPPTDVPAPVPGLPSGQSFLLTFRIQSEGQYPYLSPFLEYGSASVVAGDRFYWQGSPYPVTIAGFEDTLISVWDYSDRPVEYVYTHPTRRVVVSCVPYSHP